MILGAGPAPRGDTQAVPLLVLMRQAGFTEGELSKLAQAKANSDGLAIPELEAMRLVESSGPDAEANRARARAMMYDEKYHRAKVAVMGPIGDFFALVDARTGSAVHSAERSATLLRYVFGAFGLALVVVSWRAYVALGDTMGGSVDHVYQHIAALGKGDFSTPMPLAQPNSVLGWLGATQGKLRDLDRERSLAEESLRASEARFRQLAESLPQLVWTCQADGPCDYLSRRWLEFTGVSEDRQLGFGWLEQIHPDDRAATVAAWEAAVASDSDFRAEFRIRRHDGEYRWFDTRAVRLRDASGRTVKWFGSNTDVSERKRAEDDIRRLNAELEARVLARTAELEAANKELEAFSYSVSHDLRAPLRAIGGFSRILAEDHQDRLDAEGKRVLGIVSSETRRMGQLVDDLLAFSRLGRQSLESTEVDMTALVRAVFEEQAALHPDRSLELKLQPLPPAACDRAMMRVLLSNLISNAVKFTRPRTPAVIEVGAHAADEETTYHVKDNGVGFDMRYAHKLFGVFQRLHSTEEFDGTGVGLALVQRVIHRHQGRAWAEGSVGAGATFSFSLPVRRSHS